MKIVVVGGGVMGLACSWRLARAGAAVTLFDAGVCGEGASGAALGALWPPGVLNKHPLQAMHRESLWRFEAFVREVSEAADRPIFFERCGRIELLNSTKSIAHAQEERVASMAEAAWHGVPGPLQVVLTPEDLQAALPGCADTRFGATLCHRTARVDVPALLRALAIACQNAGVSIRERTSIVSVAAHSVETEGGRVSADAVLLTAGAWTPELLPEAPIIQAKGQAIALRRPPHLQLMQIVKRGIHYIVPWGDELYVGATTETGGGFDQTPTPAARDRLIASAAAIFPELAKAPVLRQWTGLRPDGPGHLPLMGPVPRLTDTYLCTGHFKTGVALAPLISELITPMILNELFLPEKQWFHRAEAKVQGKTASINSSK